MNRTLLLEIGVEEVPAKPLADAVLQLKQSAEESLAAHRLAYSTVETFGSPRRITLIVRDLATSQEDRVLEVRGPAAKAAWDESGAPTKAAIGFAASKKIDVATLVRRSEAGGEYAWASIEEIGRPATEVLPELLTSLIAGLSWPKAQRWGRGETRFIRPVRWIVALLGDQVIPLEFGGVSSGRTTEGHRFLAPQRSITLGSANDYPRAAEQGLFVFDAEERARLIADGIAAFETAEGLQTVIPEKTLAEVINLVECPSVAIGTFDAEFLVVPREVIQTAMTKHQRYFPVEDSAGNLVNRFVIVHNGDAARQQEIVAGHERVIRARLADAAFFYREDMVASFDVWADKLAATVFHERLGTSGAKVARVEALVDRLATLHGSTAEETSTALAVAKHSKVDLVSQVVVEFPELQGHMGYHYVAARGLGEEVALAVREHYRPRFAGDDVPSTLPGMLVSAADKLDTIVGIFAIDQAPTGSADPYALRRSAIGVLSMLLAGGLRLNLAAAIEAAIDGYSEMFPGISAGPTAASVLDFFEVRLGNILRDRGHAHDTVAAVLARSAAEPLDAAARCEALTQARALHPQVFDDLSTAYTRALNLSAPPLGVSVDVSLMGPAEQRLTDALTYAEAAIELTFASSEYPALLDTLASLRQPIDEFFDAVMVMDEDEALRNNRLRLLNRFVTLFARFADFSRLSG